MIKITRDTVSAALSKFSASIQTQEKMHILTNEARILIQQRTQAGVDMNGQQFRSYSRKRYYAPIQKRPAGYPKPSGGRSKRLGSGSALKRTMAFDAGYGQYKTGIGRGSKVQLSVSGQMLAGMQGRALSANTGVIEFVSRKSAAKAHGHHTGANNLPTRPFFGLGSTSVEKLRGELAAYVNRMRRKAGL